MLFTLIVLAAAMVVGCTDHSNDTAHVTGVMNGKSLQLSDAIQHKLSDQSIALLQTCGYSDLNPTNNWADVQKGPHLHLAFPEALNLQLRAGHAPDGKVNVELTEMVITLPLVRGGIWVRSHQDTLYFAKFYCGISTEMDHTLATAQEP
jgi:hypothetical protein